MKIGFERYIYTLFLIITLQFAHARNFSPYFFDKLTGYSNNEMVITLGEAYRLNSNQPVKHLKLRVDETFIETFKRYEGNLTVLDFSELKSIEVIVNFSDYFQKINSKTTPQSVEFFNLWIKTIGDHQNNVALKIPSNFSIASNNGIRTLSLYDCGKINPAIYQLNDIEHLYIDQLEDTTLKFACFKRLKEIRIVLGKAYKNQLRNISDCPNLERLGLHILSKTINLNPLKKNKKLTHLSIDSKKCKSFDFNVLNRNLIALDLRLDSVNHIILPDSTFPCLSYLSIDSKLLSEFPNGFEQISGLVHLSLETPQLSTFPKDLFHITTLKELVVLNSSLIKIPSEIRQLTHLHYLTLTLKKISGDFQIFKSLKNLKSLSLYETMSFTNRKRHNAYFLKWRLKMMLPYVDVEVIK